jgi:Flp pilus assembly protein TadG
MTWQARARRRLRDDRGSAAMEMAVLAPPFLLLIGLAMLGMRVQDARSTVELAAADAARSATISRTASSASANANTAANRALAQAELRCSSTSVTFTPSLSTVFNTPPGTPATVTVRVRCVVPLSDLGLGIALPGSRVVEAQFTSTLDTFRARR